jgi:phosphopantothenoylcysteine synthetase/decarboxylase
MADLAHTYLLVSGASTARRVPELIEALAASGAPPILTVLTPSAQQIISPRELALVRGHRIVESYFDDAILPRPPDGVVLVAPCSFNTLNKLAHGIADNLALSIAAEAIGRGTPVIVALAVNTPLWRHPATNASIATLRGWGVTVIEPVERDGWHTLADSETIVEAVAQW